jgi:hypothetical protein
VNKSSIICEGWFGAASAHPERIEFQLYALHAGYTALPNGVTGFTLRARNIDYPNPIAFYQGFGARRDRSGIIDGTAQCPIWIERKRDSGLAVPTRLIAIRPTSSTPHPTDPNPDI